MKVTTSLLDGSLAQMPDEQHACALEALYEVIDPEVGINIVDLGLVYTLEVDGSAARIEMTMTTPACPLSSYFDAEVERAVLQSVPELQSVVIDLTFDPPWDPSMMSSSAKHMLGW
jgi:metal-sulfur cluster biosynthetic enzyme